MNSIINRTSGLNILTKYRTVSVLIVILIIAAFLSDAQRSLRHHRSAMEIPLPRSIDKQVARLIFFFIKSCEDIGATVQ